MKKFFMAFATAIMYFSIYVAAQFFTSVIFGIIVLVICTVQLSGGGAILDTAVLLQQVTDIVNTNTSLIIMISGIVTVLTVLIIYLFKKKNMFHELQLTPIKSNNILPIGIFAVSLNIIVSFVMPMIPMPESWMDSYTKNSSAIISGNLFFTIIAITITAPIVEEIIFRGLMYKNLKSGMNRVVALIITSIVFGIVHGTIIWAAYAFILSVVLIWLFERFQSLYANILMHIIFNAAGLVVGGLTVLSDIFVYSILIIAVLCLALSTYWIKKNTAVDIDNFDMV